MENCSPYFINEPNGYSIPLIPKLNKYIDVFIQVIIFGTGSIKFKNPDAN